MIDAEQITKRDVPWLLRGPVMKFTYWGSGVAIILGTLVNPDFHYVKPGILDIIAALVIASPFGWLSGKLYSTTVARKIRKFAPDRVAVLLTPTLDIRDFPQMICFLAALGGTAVLRAFLRGLPLDFLNLPGGALISGMVIYTSALMWRYDIWYRSLPDAPPTGSYKQSAEGHPRLDT